MTPNAIDAAIRRGLDYLYRSQRVEGSWRTRYSRTFPGGVESLVLFTALASGEKLTNPKLRAALGYVNGIKPAAVYTRAMRASLYARLGTNYARRLQEDVDWLVRYQMRPSGGWGYGPEHPNNGSRRTRTDTSNTALAVMALRDAEDAGARVIPGVWKNCRRYWMQYQNSDGGWGYEPPSSFRGTSYGSMTAAGVASLTIIIDRLAGADVIGVEEISAGRKAVARGLAWLDKHHSPKINPKWVWSVPQANLYYYLYSVARVAGETGKRRIGGSGWSRPIVAELLARQRKDGSWPDPLLGGNSREIPVHTCFALLALAEARRAVLINCVTVAAGSDAAKQVGANLARWIGTRSKRRKAWQVLSAASPLEAFGEAALLYVDASGGGEIPADLAEKIRSYALSGGTVLVQAKSDDRQAAEATVKALSALMSEYSAAVLGGDHPLFNIKRRIAPVRATGIGDAARTRIIVFDEDVASAWRSGYGEKTRAAFELFANALQYATGGKVLAGRFAVRRGPGRWRVRRNISVARVRHKGDFDTSPEAFDRLNDVLAAAVSMGIREAPPVDLSTGIPANVPLLWMTGTTPPRLTVEQRKNLKRYLLAGGTIMIDPAMGGKKFFDASTAMIRGLFGAKALRPLDVNHPLITGKFAGGMGGDVSVVRFLPALRKGPGPPKLFGVEIDGRLAVVLSRYGVTRPVAGMPPINCAGLAVDDARRLGANVILYAVAERKGVTK